MKKNLQYIFNFQKLQKNWPHVLCTYSNYSSQFKCLLMKACFYSFSEIVHMTCTWYLQIRIVYHNQRNKKAFVLLIYKYLLFILFLFWMNWKMSWTSDWQWCQTRMLGMAIQFSLTFQKHMGIGSAVPVGWPVMAVSWLRLSIYRIHAHNQYSNALSLLLALAKVAPQYHSFYVTGMASTGHKIFHLMGMNLLLSHVNYSDMKLNWWHVY